MEGNDSSLALPLIEEEPAPTATAGTGAADDDHPRPSADRQLSVFSPPRPRKDRIVLFEPPRQRQRWGERQVVPHVNWGDLYFDLFYVAAAYNLSYVLLYSMNTQGFLYLLGLMGPILFEWFTRTYFDARYSWGTDPWHGLVEIVRLCFLATAVVHIRPVYEMSQPYKYPDMFGFSLGMLMLTVCNIYVSAEVMFKVVGDAAARRAERENIVSYTIQGVLYLLSAVFAGKSYYGNPDGHDNREGSYPPGLDSLFSACTSLLAGMGGEGVEGEGAPSSSPASDDTPSPTNLPVYLCLGAWVFGVLFWALKWVLIPTKKHKECTVPLNVEYCIHRFGEIVMILLGESVLSLLITETSVNNGYYVTFYAGIVGVTLLQYLYFKYQPHSADEHALRKSWQAGAVFHVLMFIFCIALVGLGTGYKAFLIDHSHSSDSADYADFISGSGDDSKIMHDISEHKYRAAGLYCISLGVVLLTLDLMYATHKGPKKYWEFLKTKAGFAISMFRNGMCVFATTLALWVHNTETLALVGTLTLAVEVAATVIIEYFIHMANPDDFDEVAGHWSDHFVVSLGEGHDEDDVKEAPEGAYA